MKIILTKTASGALAPIDQQSIDAIAKLKLGEGVEVSIKYVNNVEFHRKLFALLNFAFDHWEPVGIKYKGIQVEKNFEQFRRDLICLAGHGEAVINLKGEIRVVAKSLKFSKMDQEEREALYSSVINVILKKILTNYTKQDLDNVINNLLAFT